MKKILKSILGPFYQPTKKIYLYCLYLKDFYLFRRFNSSRFSLRWRDRYPQLYDATHITPFDSHYIYHPAWAARILAETKPVYHVDISSILYFSAMISAFIPTKFYDYRPANLKLSNLESLHADLNKLPFADNSIPSLSCMHTVEHIGLGRYGDPLDPNGDLKAMSELERVLAINGNLLFVVPVGKPKIMFNAHRIYSYKQIVDQFSRLSLKKFSLVDDNGQYIDNATQELADKQIYGCGCFWFKK
jgi:SAM-dependent methyltransferase